MNYIEISVGMCTLLVFQRTESLPSELVDFCKQVFNSVSLHGAGLLAALEVGQFCCSWCSFWTHNSVFAVCLPLSGVVV